MRLEILQHSSNDGSHLFYYRDEEGAEENDTFHDTLDDALEQARVGFNVQPQERQDAEEKIVAKRLTSPQV